MFLEYDGGLDAAHLGGPADPAPNALFNTDAFRITCFKVLMCSKRTRHSWKSCPYAHPGEMARRRPLSKGYSSDMCPQVRSGRECPLGDSCPFSHNTFEAWLHPDKYRTQMCTSGARCAHEVCFFAHSNEELRSWGSGAASAAATTPASTTTIASSAQCGSPASNESFCSSRSALATVSWDPPAAAHAPTAEHAPGAAALQGGAGGGGYGEAPPGGAPLLWLVAGDAPAAGGPAAGSRPGDRLGAVAPGGTTPGPLWLDSQQLRLLQERQGLRAAGGAFQAGPSEVHVPGIPDYPGDVAAALAASGPPHLLTLQPLMQNAEDTRRAADAARFTARDAAAHAQAAARAAAGYAAALGLEPGSMEASRPAVFTACGGAAPPATWGAADGRVAFTSDYYVTQDGAGAWQLPPAAPAPAPALLPEFWGGGGLREGWGTPGTPVPGASPTSAAGPAWVQQQPWVILPAGAAPAGAGGPRPGARWSVGPASNGSAVAAHNQTLFLVAPPVAFEGLPRGM